MSKVMFVLAVVLATLLAFGAPCVADSAYTDASTYLGFGWNGVSIGSSGNGGYQEAGSYTRGSAYGPTYAESLSISETNTKGYFGSSSGRNYWWGGEGCFFTIQGIETEGSSETWSDCTPTDITYSDSFANQGQEAYFVVGNSANGVYAFAGNQSGASVWLQTYNSHHGLAQTEAYAGGLTLAFGKCVKGYYAGVMGFSTSHSGNDFSGRGYGYFGRHVSGEGYLETGAASTLAFRAPTYAYSVGIAHASANTSGGYSYNSNTGCGYGYTMGGSFTHVSPTSAKAVSFSKSASSN